MYVTNIMKFKNLFTSQGSDIKQNCPKQDVGSICYSQEGEDMILARVFGEKRDGFYVDIGAHHPTRFSNTKYFYDLGWRGINIDAKPGSMKLFNEERLRDINLEFAVSDREENLKFYLFNEPALNTFSSDFAVNYSQIEPYKIIKVIDINTLRLDRILEKYLPLEQRIDFISIDVEGFDYRVIKSNNWEKYSPTIVLIEFQTDDLRSFLSDKLYLEMSNLGYTFFAKTVNTIFFKKHNF